jgi:hypothetical protein
MSYKLEERAKAGVASKTKVFEVEKGEHNNLDYRDINF